MPTFKVILDGSGLDQHRFIGIKRILQAALGRADEEATVHLGDDETAWDLIVNCTSQELLEGTVAKRVAAYNKDRGLQFSATIESFSEQITLGAVSDRNAERERNMIDAYLTDIERQLEAERQERIRENDYFSGEISTLNDKLEKSDAVKDKIIKVAREQKADYELQLAQSQEDKDRLARDVSVMRPELASLRERILEAAEAPKTPQEVIISNLKTCLAQVRRAEEGIENYVKTIENIGIKQLLQLADTDIGEEVNRILVHASLTEADLASTETRFEETTYHLNNISRYALAKQTLTFWEEIEAKTPEHLQEVMKQAMQLDTARNTVQEYEQMQSSFACRALTKIAIEEKRTAHQQAIAIKNITTKSMIAQTNMPLFIHQIDDTAANHATYILYAPIGMSDKYINNIENKITSRLSNAFAVPEKHIEDGLTRFTLSLVHLDKQIDIFDLVSDLGEVILLRDKQ